MKDIIAKLSARIQYLLVREEGQDLVEYALLVALIGFAAVGGEGRLATDINQAFTNIGAKLTATA